MDKVLRLELKHTQQRPSSIALLNLPDSGTYMSPLRMRSLAQALINAAEDCEAKIAGRMLNAPVNLDYEINLDNFSPNPRHESLIVKLVSTFGVGRFSLTDLHQILRPNALPRHLPEDAVEIKQAAAAMVRNGMLIQSFGPCGGKGWVLTDEAVLAAKRLVRQKRPL